MDGKRKTALEDEEDEKTKRHKPILQKRDVSDSSDRPMETESLKGDPTDSSSEHRGLNVASWRSNRSMYRVIHFDQGHSRHESDFRSNTDDQSSCSTISLPHLVKSIEEEIINEVKNEMKRFERFLSPDVPVQHESQTQDDEAFESEKKDSCMREAIMKFTVDKLRSKNQTKFADTLEKCIKGELTVCQQKLKSKLRRMSSYISEGLTKQENPKSFKKIFTELYITAGGSGEVNVEHEVRQIETSYRGTELQEAHIKCKDIFKPLPGQDKHIRTVLTKGIAGIGKTMSVRKFLQDWVDGKANQDIQLIFSLPFRTLNLMKGEDYSLIELVHHFFVEAKEIVNFEKYKVLFVFDGLDESRLPLDFHKNKTWCDITKSASVDVLLTNLIEGNLLSSALIWITSRPAAVDLIPVEFVDQVTEIRGFNNEQKEEYFKKRIDDPNKAAKIIKHVKSSRSLYIMCHIPVFSCILATILEKMLGKVDSENMPKTLTQMYTHFLIISLQTKNQKYLEAPERGKTEPETKADQEMIMKLGRLAFEQLDRGNLIFYEADLLGCGIDVREAAVYSGVCTQMFREESWLHQEKVFSFVHLSIQEFLAAVYVLSAFLNDNVNLMAEGGPAKRPSALPEDPSVSILHKSAVDKTLKSENGHLDLFLRFLVGLSLESNQALLQNVLKETRGGSDPSGETIKYIKEKIKEDPPPDRCINLFHCLNELNDNSLENEIQNSFNSGSLSERDLSPAQLSALVFVMLNSEKEFEEFDLRKYSRSEEGLVRLLPAIKQSRKATLSGCNLTGRCCKTLASALRSDYSHLRELDLSSNDLQDTGVKLLCEGLGSPVCKVEKLKLSFCGVTGKGCEYLASALTSNPLHLRQLDLSYNHLEDSGVTMLTARVEDPLYKLEQLRVDHNAACWLKNGMKTCIVKPTFDPNTVHKLLTLSEDNTKLTWGDEHEYPDHPDRFEYCPLVVCREGMTGQCYWEVDWTGLGAYIGVTYKGMTRKGKKTDAMLGHNDKSWTLRCMDDHYIACHDSKSLTIPVPSVYSYKVGVHLDWEGGTLSFFSVSSGILTHLHSFHANFTESLYPAFRLWNCNSSVSI